MNSPWPSHRVDVLYPSIFTLPWLCKCKMTIDAFTWPCSTVASSSELFLVPQNFKVEIWDNTVSHLAKFEPHNYYQTVFRHFMNYNVLPQKVNNKPLLNPMTVVKWQILCSLRCQGQIKNFRPTELAFILPVLGQEQWRYSCDLHGNFTIVYLPFDCSEMFSIPVSQCLSDFTKINRKDAINVP